MRITLKKEKFINILAISESEGFNLIERHPHSYREIYVFENNGKKAGIIFNYNGKCKFTKIGVAANHTTVPEFATEVKNKFENQVNIILEESHRDNTVLEGTIIDFDSHVANLFEEKYAPYKVLYIELKERLSVRKIEIENVIHKDYQEVYYLKRLDEIAVIQFYYDGLDRFTRAQPMLNKCNSNKLLSEINDSIQELIMNC